MNFEKWKQDYITVSKITAEIFGNEFAEIRATHMVRQDNPEITNEQIENMLIDLNSTKDVKDFLATLT